MLDEDARRAIDADIDEAPMEEIERRLRHHGRLSWNVMALMGLGAAIALAGLLSALVPQALALAAAAIIAPAFEPFAKVTVGVVQDSWYAVRRGLIAAGGGYLVLAVVGALAYLLLYLLDLASPEALAASEGLKSVIDPTAADWLISASGAAASVVIISAFEKPSWPVPLWPLRWFRRCTGRRGLGRRRRRHRARGLPRVLLDALLVVGLGSAILYLKQRLVHANRRPFP